MGLIKAALGAAGGVMADQWKEYFYCEAIPVDVLVCKGQKRTSGRGSNTKGSANVISNGSVVAVADGQCMCIVENGKVVDICAVPGEFVYDTSIAPSIFTGDLGENIKNTFSQMGKRFAFGGEAGQDQRVYYFNTKEIIGNKYGTPSPIPFRVVDERAGIDIDISIRCFGEYSYRLTDPILFYTNVCGNVEQEYRRDQIEGQLKSELLTALQPAFAKISAMGIRYSALPGHTTEIRDALSEILSSEWALSRGIEIWKFGVSSVKASEEDEAMLKELQRNAGFPGRGDENRRRQHRRRCRGLYGHGHGRRHDGRRHERPEPVRHGPAADATATGAAGCPDGPRRLDLLLRPGGKSGQVLPKLRPAQTCSQSRGKLGLLLRRRQHRQILCRVREAPAFGRRLDLLLRCREQGQVLRRMRPAQTRRSSPVPLR